MYSKATRHAAFALNRRLALQGTGLWTDFEQMKKETVAQRQMAFESANEIVVLLTSTIGQYSLNDFDREKLLKNFEGDALAKTWHLYWLGMGSIESSLVARFDSKTIIDALNWHALKSHSGVNDFQLEEMKIKKELCPSTPAKSLFGPEEFDLYSDRKSGELFLFFGKDINWSINEVVFDCRSKRVSIIYDNENLDLGASVRYLLWPDFMDASSLAIVQTLKGKALKGKAVPLKTVSKRSIDYISDKESRVAFDRFYKTKSNFDVMSLMKGLLQ